MGILMGILLFPFFLIPGVGHIRGGRPWKGVFLFLWFVLFLNCVLLADLLGIGTERPTWMLAAACCAAIVWLYAMADIFKLIDRKAAERG